MAKRKIPETSREAHASLDLEDLREIYRKIMYALSMLGEATTEECAAFLKIDHSKIWKRYSELRKMGLIYRPGNKRLLRSGRSGFTYRLTTEGLPNTEASEKALKGPSIAYYSKEIQKVAKGTTQSKLF